MKGKKRQKRENRYAKCDYDWVDDG